MAKKIGIVGGGVVGGGVYEILTSKFPHVCTVQSVAVRDLSKPRAWASAGTKFVDRWEAVVEDPEVEVVVEVMGGTTTAKECVFRALELGKAVVTANKALLAEYTDEVVGKAKGPLGFEAAVCGGIPIIATLQQHLAGDEISSVSGIMNGTTNFMLSKMESSNVDYGDVLKEAQELGFAEADPTADVEGHDVRAKIALLAKLAFGTTVSVEAIPTLGISRIQAVDFDYAKLLGATIRLLGTARKDGESLSVYVAPHVVPATHPAGFASATGPTNVVSIDSKQLGVASLRGAGAGRYPTARSIVADVLRVCAGATVPPFPDPNPNLTLTSDYASRFYVRVIAADQLGIVKAIGEMAERNVVSINAILQNPITDPTNMAFVVTTDAVKHSAVQAFAADVASAPFALSPPLVLNILD
ncbi:hypothetical protein CTAYLR_008419 [Chrysophaeum taylorii]|uniref:Homoserine dehydrogenase n=1 Tax=Chrysophaeum taylorii TaxID=2483200 RepID=A0AAD7XSB3_9STRA|nr:hypothetical protein CTAYLR_008419 [Chrysophaeum taylorii]